MHKPPFVGKRFKDLRDLIRDFCRRATDTGGVLLVTGPRGVGKTRLVDEALNERNPDTKPGYFRCLLGNISTRRRYKAVREPRQMNRFLLKINVDFNFPHTNQAEKIHADDNAPIYQLLHNIIFSLTSEIDCRISRRLHSKTLVDRLGWYYWFAPNALSWDKTSHASLLASLIISILYLTACFYRLLPNGPCPNILWLSAFLLSIIAITLLWVILRYRDWKSLEHMSASLYNLVHAQESKKSTDQKNHISSSLPFLVLAIFLILLTVYWPDFVAKLQQFKLPSDFSDWRPAMGVLAISATWLYSYKTQKKAEFGSKNPIWMLTLLRRYLYQCHRCGIEPVLVLSLEEMDTYWLDCSNRCRVAYHTQLARETLPDSPQNTVNDLTPDTPTTEQNTMAPSRPDNLDLFLFAMARLKTSLGAEFLWIIISGPELLARLQRDRYSHHNGLLGLLGTVIHQEISLGQVPWQIAQELFQKMKGEHDFAPKQQQALWLRSRGNLSSLVRSIQGGKEQNPGMLDSTLAANLALCLDKIWEGNVQVGFVAAKKAYLDKLRQEWVQTWIRAGMFELANRLLMQPMRQNEIRNALPDAAAKFKDNFPADTDPAIIALALGEPHLLTLLGQQIFYACLNCMGYIDTQKGVEYVCFSREKGRDIENTLVADLS